MSETHNIAIIELYHGGSHARLTSLLTTLFLNSYHLKPNAKIPDPESPKEASSAPSLFLLTLTDKKWHWRARCGPLQLLPQLDLLPRPIHTLFTSSVGSLPEILALCPDLNLSRKVLYFHENQLVYPVRESKERDYQYGYNQILSALAADVVLFNSSYNMRSFLDNIDPFLNKMPDFKPKGISDRIRSKCSVLHFPVEFPVCERQSRSDQPLHIIWPHRWEHDKNPEQFFEALESLAASNCDFRVSVLGQCYGEIPAVFADFRSSHPDKILQWGPLESHSDYTTHLNTGDVVVSTAHHEFYGVAMLEGVAAGCFPLAPNRLSYPELYPGECLFNTTPQLTKQLRQMCGRPELARRKWEGVVRQVGLERFAWEALRARYREVLGLV